MPYLEAASSKPRSLRYMDLEESKYLPMDADFHQTVLVSRWTYFMPETRSRFKRSSPLRNEFEPLKVCLPLTRLQLVHCSWVSSGNLRTRLIFGLFWKWSNFLRFFTMKWNALVPGSWTHWFPVTLAAIKDYSFSILTERWQKCTLHMCYIRLYSCISCSCTA